MYIGSKHEFIISYYERNISKAKTCVHIKENRKCSYCSIHCIDRRLL